MFVTQNEIESRLKSDDNLLVALLKDSPATNKEVQKKEDNDSNDNKERTESANLSDSIQTVVGELVDDSNDVKLQRILDNADQESRSLDRTGKSGRPRDAINRSTEQRADIALMGSVLGHGLAADLLGISTASSSLHARGLVNANDVVDEDLSKTVKRKLGKIRNKSADALIKVLDNVDSNQMLDKLNTAKDAMFVASQLAGIIQKVQPKEEDIKPTAQFVIIQPTVKTVEQYEIVNV